MIEDIKNTEALEEDREEILKEFEEQINGVKRTDEDKGETVDGHLPI